jgi:uncharacterized protein (DUF433 family)
MSATLLSPTLTVPLRRDESGVLRIGATRIPLECVIAGYLDGDRPEQIVENFPALRLAEVYAVIGYFLENRDEVEAYLAEQERRATKTRQDHEAHHPPRVNQRAVLQERWRQQFGKDFPAKVQPC